MSEPLPSWPTTPPAYGRVVLRAFTDADAHLAVELGDDPYIPLIGSLPARPTAEQALAWIRRQRDQLAEQARFSFAIADAESGNAVGRSAWGSGTCRRAAPRRATRFPRCTGVAASRPARCRR